MSQMGLIWICILMGPSSWVHPYGSILMGSSLWVHPYGSFLMGSSIWVHPYGFIRMLPFLWVHPYGSILTGPLLWVHPYGSFSWINLINDYEIFQYIDHVHMRRSEVLNKILFLTWQAGVWDALCACEKKTRLSNLGSGVPCLLQIKPMICSAMGNWRRTIFLPHQAQLHHHCQMIILIS